MRIYPRSLLATLALTAILTIAPRIAHADDIDDYIAAQREKQKIAGLSLAVVRDGMVVKQEGYGLANVELGVPATPASVYEIGSISKTFTATLVLKLVDEGKLGLDDLVSRYVAGTPASWGKITVRNLLNQTTGISNYTALPTFLDDASRPTTPAALVRIVASKPLAFAPGTNFSYSNTNYFLLGLIAEKAGGAPYAILLRDKILTPLGMGATRVFDPADIVPNRASGYAHDADGARRNAKDWDATWLFGAGAILSTVGDLTKWAAAQDTDALLKPATRALRQTLPTFPAGTPPTNYGFGWVIDSLKGHREIWHNGGVPGFRSQLARFVDDKLTVIVLTNSGDAAPESIARGVAGFYVPALSHATEKPIADAEPEVTATLRKIFADLAAGTGDPTLYTPEMWHLMQSGLQNNVAYQSLGPIQSVDLLKTEYFPEPGFHTYRYRLTYATAVTIVEMSRDKEGKINGMSIKPD